jgi:hypothetical protein
VTYTLLPDAAIDASYDCVLVESLKFPQQQICPTCKNKSISLTPLAKDEIYTIAMQGKSKRGLEMEFSNRK